MLQTEYGIVDVALIRVTASGVGDGIERRECSAFGNDARWVHTSVVYEFDTRLPRLWFEKKFINNFQIRSMNI